mmetsp:Transcript_18151/g.56977  ORF Transcript_18151/g.56977 Transcript_18151/m.56977 type:complete len:308 (-) Transcript_18151:3727-4650(-)
MRSTPRRRGDNNSLPCSTPSTPRRSDRLKRSPPRSTPSTPRRSDRLKHSLACSMVSTLRPSNSQNLRCWMASILRHSDHLDRRRPCSTASTQRRSDRLKSSLRCSTASTPPHSGSNSLRCSMVSTPHRCERCRPARMGQHPMHTRQRHYLRLLRIRRLRRTISMSEREATRRRILARLNCGCAKWHWRRQLLTWRAAHSITLQTSRIADSCEKDAMSSPASRLASVRSTDWSWTFSKRKPCDCSTKYRRRVKPRWNLPRAHRHSSLMSDHLWPHCLCSRRSQITMIVACSEPANTQPTWSDALSAVH